MSENIERLSQHIQSLRQRTFFSSALYLGFLVASTLSAARGARLQDVTTVVAIVFIAGAFFLIPRDYRPAHLARALADPDTGMLTTQLGSLQRMVVFLRAAYFAGAIVTLAILPRVL